MKLLYRICITIFLSIQAMAQPIKTLEVDGHTLYTATVPLPSGEIAFFGFEPIIDQDRSNRWREYENRTMPYTSSSRGLFYAIFKTGVDPKLHNEYQEWLGSVGFTNTQDHRNELWNLILNMPQDKANSMAESMEGIASGCLGFNTGKKDYVAYISKEPITGFFSLPLSCLPQDLDAYIGAYDSLIMVMSSFDGASNEQFHHRGIFRNPISALRKDYQGTGILLHAFAGYARSIARPENKIMHVNPNGNKKMRSLFLSAFPKVERRPGGYGEMTVSVQDLVNKFESIVSEYEDQAKS